MSGYNATNARNTDNAPKSLLFSQTVAFSHYNNLSAQLPLDPATGELVAGGAKEQAEQCLKNVKAILESIDHVMDDIVRITVFLKDLSDVDAVNDVYPTFFPGYLPARSVVAVADLPLGALVQIEAVVSHGDGTPPQPPEDAAKLVIEPNNTDAAPQDPYSTQTVAFSHYNHISAQLPLDASGATVAGGAKEQAAQCLANVKAIVESVDHVMDDLVRVNYYLKDLADADAVGEAHAAAFPGYKPAGRIVGVSALPGGALVQVDAVVANAEGTPPQA